MASLSSSLMSEKMMSDFGDGAAGEALKPRTSNERRAMNFMIEQNCLLLSGRLGDSARRRSATSRGRLN